MHVLSLVPVAGARAFPTHVGQAAPCDTHAHQVTRRARVSSVLARARGATG